MGEVDAFAIVSSDDSMVDLGFGTGMALTVVQTWMDVGLLIANISSGS